MFDSHVSLDPDELADLIGQSHLSGVCLVRTTDDFLTPHTDPQRFSSSSFRLTEGVEIPFSAEEKDRFAMLLAGRRADYVVNSVLSVDGQPLDDTAYYTRQSRHGAYRRYLECVLDSLDAGYAYCALGPLTLPGRYAFYPSPNIEYREFPDLFDSILMRAVFAGKALEVSTAAWPYLNDLMPSSSVLARYREMGGKLITLASGAHRGVFCGKHFAQAREKLISLGFTEYAVYSDMTPTLFAL